MNTRSDAIQIASTMILKGIEITERHNGLTTFGTLEMEPASIKIIPDKVTCSFDARLVKDENLAVIMDEVKREFKKIAKEGKGISLAKPLDVEFTRIYTQSAVHFDETNIATVKKSALDLFSEDEIREIVNGAGHDSCVTSTRVPTSMIFVPSKNGISHNTEEYSSPDEVDNGFRVLLKIILNYDVLRASKAVYILFMSKILEIS